MLETILGIGKIYYELINLYANDKMKLEHFLKDCHISSEYTYMNDAFSNYISEKIETGYFHTEITTNDIQDYITIFFDRITRNLILAKYYNSDEILKKPNFHKDELIHMLFPPNSLLYKFSLDTVSNEMKRTILTLNLLCNGLIAPIMEELYFRGFLLPT